MRPQRGAALLVALIMLTLMTLMAIASLNIGRINMEIVGNMQNRSQAVAAANSAIQEAISTIAVMESSAAVFGDPCDGTANKRCFDINGDETNDIEVLLDPPPACLLAQAIANSSLNFQVVGTSDCTVQVDQTSFGIEGGVSGNSLCANTLWEVRAIATDVVTETTVTVTEGVAMLVGTNNVATFCPGPT